MKSFYEISGYNKQPLHRLSDVLFAGLLSFLRNGKDCSDMLLFARQYETFLREFISLENGIPSHDTFARVFSVLEPDLLRHCLYAYRKDVTDILSRQRVEPEPKNATVIRAENSKLPILQAWVAENSLCFIIPKKSVIQTAEPTPTSFIEGLDIRNAVVSVDTVSYQKEYASLVIRKDGHYFLPLREQSALYKAVVNDFDSRTADRSSEIREYGCERIETLKCSIIAAKGILSKRTPVPEGLKTLIKIDSVSVADGKDTRKTHYYMSDEAEQSATYFNALADSFPKTNLLCILFKDEPHSPVMQGNARENLFLLKRFTVQINREAGILNRMY